MTPQDNNLNKAQVRRTGAPGAVLSILLAVAAVVLIIGIWFSTAENNGAHPVTGSDTPARTQPENK